MTVGEIAAASFADLMKRSAGTINRKDSSTAAQHGPNLMGGIVKGFQNRPTSLNVSRRGARAARRFHRSDHSRPLKFGTVRSVFKEARVAPSFGWLETTAKRYASDGIDDCDRCRKRCRHRRWPRWHGWFAHGPCCLLFPGWGPWLPLAALPQRLSVLADLEP